MVQTGSPRRSIPANYHTIQMSYSNLPAATIRRLCLYARHRRSHPLFRCRWCRDNRTKKGGTDAPSKSLIINLVKALSTVFRPGEDDSQKVEVAIPIAEAAWVIAFIKWCVGTPTVLFDNEEVVSSGADTVVTVRVSMADAQVHRPQIVILNELGEIKDLIRDLPGGAGDFKGMIGRKLFATHLMQNLFGKPSSLAFRACIEALPLACRF